MYYDETKDQSEKFGWKKVCNEYAPTEQEQTYWGNITMVFAVAMALIAIFL